MKQLTLVCDKCKARLIIIGATIQEIIAKIDQSKWTDRPEEQKATHCPSCEKKYQLESGY